MPKQEIKSAVGASYGKENRLRWVLSKLPSLSDLEKKEDIEEYLSAKWQKKAKQKQLDILLDLIEEKDINKSLKKLLAKSSNDRASLEFNPETWVGKNKLNQNLIKQTMVLRPIRFARLGRALAIAVVILMFSFLAVEFMPKRVDKYLALIDNTLKKPIVGINRLMGLGGPRRLLNNKLQENIIVNKENLSKYIINNQNKLENAVSQGTKSFAVTADDINGRVAGVEDGKNSLDQSGDQSCLYKKIKNLKENK